MLWTLWRLANDLESFCWKYFMDKLQLSHKYELGITSIELRGIGIDLLHIRDWEQNSSLFMQTSCTIFASVENDRSFSRLWKRFIKPNRCCSRLPFAFNTCSKITFTSLMGRPHGSMTTRAPEYITNLSALEDNPLTISCGLKQALTGLRPPEVRVLRHCTNTCKILGVDRGKNEVLKI